MNLGVVVLYSAYFESGTKMGPYNEWVLRTMADHIDGHGRPFTVGGDVQNHPDVLSYFLKLILPSAEVVAPSSPTYFHTMVQSLLDYFLVDKRIAPLFVRPFVQTFSL